MTGVPLRAYARMRGVSLAAVQKALASKRISANPDGSIDPERANRDWERNTFAGKTVDQVIHEQPSLAGMPQAMGGRDFTTEYHRARAVRETFAARTAQLEYEERAGKLIPAARAAEYAAGFSSIVRDALMALPDRVAPMLAALDDEKAIHKMLSNELNALLKKLNKAVADSGL